MANKKCAVVEKDCVSCGYCQKVCPKGAIKVKNGVIAVVDEIKCIGCKKCEKVCPAGVIFMKEVTQ